MSLSVADHNASLPVAYWLYAPQDASDSERRRKAEAPEEVGFKTKPEVAIEQLRWACEAGLPDGVALLDAGYGNNNELRADITELGLSYAAGWSIFWNAPTSQTPWNAPTSQTPMDKTLRQRQRSSRLQGGRLASFYLFRSRKSKN